MKYESMDDVQFRELVVAVWTFIRSEHAQRFLWPQIEPQLASEAMEEFLLGYEY